MVDPDYQMIGPIPAAMARRKNRYRTQLVVTARGRAKLSTIVTSLVAVAESTRHSHRLKWFVDVDPYESLRLPALEPWQLLGDNTHVNPCFSAADQA